MCKGNIVHSGKHTQHHLPTTAPTILKLTTVASKQNRSTNSNLYATENHRIKAMLEQYSSGTLSALPYIWHRPTPPSFENSPKPVVEQFEIKFPVTMKMVPKCRILVYYVRGDKETVADTIKYDVEDVLENQVRGSLFGHAVMIYMGIIQTTI